MKLKINKFFDAEPHFERQVLKQFMYSRPRQTVTEKQKKKQYNLVVSGVEKKNTIKDAWLHSTLMVI